MAARTAGGAWFETRGCAALLAMRDRGRAGSSPAVTRREATPSAHASWSSLLPRCFLA